MAAGFPRQDLERQHTDSHRHQPGERLIGEVDEIVMGRAAGADQRVERNQVGNALQGMARLGGSLDTPYPEHAQYNAEQRKTIDLRQQQKLAGSRRHNAVERAPEEAVKPSGGRRVGRQQGATRPQHRQQGRALVPARQVPHRAGHQGGGQGADPIAQRIAIMTMESYRPYRRRGGAFKAGKTR